MSALNTPNNDASINNFRIIIIIIIIYIVRIMIKFMDAFMKGRWQLSWENETVIERRQPNDSPAL